MISILILILCLIWFIMRIFSLKRIDNFYGLNNNIQLTEKSKKIISKRLINGYEVIILIFGCYFLSSSSIICGLIIISLIVFIWTKFWFDLINNKCTTIQTRVVKKYKKKTGKNIIDTLELLIDGTDTVIRKNVNVNDYDKCTIGSKVLIIRNEFSICILYDYHDYCINRIK